MTSIGGPPSGGVKMARPIVSVSSEAAKRAFMPDTPTSISVPSCSRPLYSQRRAGSVRRTRLDSGLTAIIQASAPLFTALLALRFSRGDRVRGSRLAGLVVGFAGVALLVGGRPSGQIVAALAVVFSAVCYAAAALYAGRRLRGVSPLVTALGTLAAATLATLPVGLFQLPSHMTSWKVTASVLTLGIAGTGLGYILYYGLIAGAGASRAILITYLVPTFAVVYGAVLLGEPVTGAALGGLALVLAGVGLGTGAVRLGRARRVASSET